MGYSSILFLRLDDRKSNGIRSYCSKGLCRKWRIAESIVNDFSLVAFTLIFSVHYILHREAALLANFWQNYDSEASYDIRRTSADNLKHIFCQDPTVTTC